jgi:FtsZ-binding cell division protein ZapB
MPYPQRSKLLRAFQQWKAKAIARRRQIDVLNKRVNDLMESRDAWKAEAQARQGRITELQEKNRRLKHSDRRSEKKPSCTL